MAIEINLARVDPDRYVEGLPRLTVTRRFPAHRRSADRDGLHAQCREQSAADSILLVDALMCPQARADARLTVELSTTRDFSTVKLGGTVPL